MLSPLAIIIYSYSPIHICSHLVYYIGNNAHAATYQSSVSILVGELGS
jgi:hypothetical protein